MEGINWLSIVVGALVPLVVGFIWYNPKLFGNAWMESIGLKEGDLQGGNIAVIYGVAYVMALLLAYQFSSYIGYHQPEDQTFIHGGYHAGMLAIFVAVPVLVTNSLFERRNWTNIFINAAYWIVSCGLIGGVCALFF
jgi:uncharacterized membrane protein